MKPKFTLLSFSFFLIASFNILAQQLVDISSPEVNGGQAFNAGRATFGGLTIESYCDFVAITAEADILEAGNQEACDSITTDFSNKIAFIDRGNCNFTDKARNAQTAGAIAVIICNNVANGGAFGMTGDNAGDITIPVVSLSKEACDALKLALPASITIATRIPSITPTTVFWGDNLGEGDFAGGLNDWTTTGISSDTAVWTWSEKGITSGPILGNSALGVIASPTVCNGTMIFDADFLNRTVTQQPYPDQNGELISPVIDCTNCGPGAIEFYQYNLPLNGTTSLSFSTDGGNSWSTPIDIGTENIFNATTQNIVGTEIKKISILAIEGAGQLRFKFIFDGDFYFWSIDDVRIVEAIENDLAISSIFYTPASAVQPVSQIATDTFLFAADVSNLGALPQTNVIFKATLRNEDTGALIYEDSIILNEFPVGIQDSTLSIPRLFPPELPVALYSITYSIKADAPDGSPDNNEEIAFFAVSEDVFSKELNGGDVGIRGFNNAGETIPYAVGAYYTMSASSQEDFVASKASFVSSISNGILDGKVVNIFLLKVKDEVTFNFSNFNFESDNITADGQLDVLGFTQFVYPEGSDNVGFFEADILDFETNGVGVALDPGGRYFLMADYQEESKEIFHAFSTEIDYPGISTLMLFDQWFSGFSDLPVSPVMRMNIMLSTSVDERPLPLEAMKVFPNPARDFIRAEFDFERYTSATVTMADINGRVIEHRNLELYNETLSFNTSNLATGVYLLRVATAKGSRTQKFVVQR